MNDQLRYYIVDTETSGTDETAGVCEVAFLEIDENFNELARVQSLIDPEVMISPSASGIHGLVDDDVKDFPTLSEFFGVDDPSCYGKMSEKTISERKIGRAHV